MKRVFILLTTFFSFAVKGQESKPTKKFNRILIGVNFSPDYNYRSLKSNGGSPSGGLVIESRNDIEIAKFGCTAGLNVCINFSKLAGLETGIQYSNKGYKTKNLDLVFGSPGPGLPTRSKFIYTYQYIGIPLKAKFTVGKGNIRFLSSAGFMTNFLLNTKTTNILEYTDGKTDKKSQSTTSEYKNVDISPMISLGIDYKINDNIHLIAEPTFRYGVIKTRDAPITENLWNAGINIGFYYGLK
jgi:hypothetical protein